MWVQPGDMSTSADGCLLSPYLMLVTESPSPLLSSALLSSVEVSRQQTDVIFWRDQTIRKIMGDT